MSSLLSFVPRHRHQALAGSGAMIVAVVIVVALSSAGQRARAATATVSAAQVNAAAAIVTSVLPGSSVSLAPAPAMGLPSIPDASSVPSTESLNAQITEPASNALQLPGSGVAALAAPALRPGRGSSFATAELGWKAAVAAALAGATDPSIVGYTVMVPGATFTTAQQASLTGQIRGAAGLGEHSSLPKIGTVPLTSLVGQLQSNVKVLESALPSGTVLASNIVSIPLNASDDDYALEVDLKVTKLAALQDYEGDIVDGLGTGLVGGPTAPAEGLAIDVVDQQGLRAGWWSAVRAGTGSALADPQITLTGGAETATYPNLTGGPAPTVSVPGGGGSAASVKSYALHPHRGIGPVSIRESKARVERALDDRTSSCARACVRANLRQCSR